MIARTNGLLAGLVSVILGIGAHGFAGGALPDAAQLMMLALIGLGVGALRSAQRHDSKTSIAAVLLGGQLVTHLTLSLMGAAGGHHHAVNSMAMLGWHLIAVPAAVLVLCAAAWLLRVVSSTIGIVDERGRLNAETTSSVVPRTVVALHDLAPRLSVGMRAPPAVG